MPFSLFLPSVSPCSVGLLVSLPSLLSLLLIFPVVSERASLAECDGFFAAKKDKSKFCFSSFSCCCWRRKATWAAMTLCRSAMRLQSGQAQSFHLQNLLCPLRMEMTPWFLQRAHLGERSEFEAAEPSVVEF